MEAAKLLDFRDICDHRGHLTALEIGIDIPFDIQRIYYIFNTPAGTERGFHAHKQLEQVLICLNGSVKIRVESLGEKSKVFHLANPSQGLYIGNLVWREMFDFSDEAVLLVLASEHYDESDYIRDYDEFCRLSVSKRDVLK